MKRAKKPATKRTTRAYKTLRAKPEPAPQRYEPEDRRLVAVLLSALCSLGDENPWMLAAALDWIRTQWRGEADVLAKPGAVADALLWVLDRERDVRASATKEAMAGALRAAVTA